MELDGHRSRSVSSYSHTPVRTSSTRPPGSRIRAVVFDGIVTVYFTVVPLRTHDDATVPKTQSYDKLACVIVPPGRGAIVKAFSPVTSIPQTVSKSHWHTDPGRVVIAARPALPYGGRPRQHLMEHKPQPATTRK